MIKLELAHQPNCNSFVLFAFTFALFSVAAIAEIGGGYLIWHWLREKRKPVFGLIGGLVLFLYGVIPTLQPSNFGRVYAAYGGYLAMAIIWGLLVDKKRPDRYEIIGGLIVILGSSIIFYYPR